MQATRPCQQIGHAQRLNGVLDRYGASQYMYGKQDGAALIAFFLNGRHVRFVLPLPARNDDRFTNTPAGRRRRSEDAAHAAWEQACRSSWRALALVIKAKLEAVESGITVFEDEFLAHIVLPGGQSVGDWMRPQIAAAYDRGKRPKMLPMPEELTREVTKAK